MTQTNSNTNARKGKHLTDGERYQIQILLKEGYSHRHIGRVLGRNHQTINNEVKRGTVTQINRVTSNGKDYIYSDDLYFADAGQAYYDDQRLKSGRQPKWLQASLFMEWADQKMLEEKWSPDAVVQRARKDGLFEDALIPCTTTLYDWIDRGVMRTKNMDLLEKLSRKSTPTSQGHRQNKRILGPSIDLRPEAINDRSEFGHWEIDTVIGQQTKLDPVLLTLVERQTRFEIILKLKGKDAQSVNQAITDLKERAGDAFPQLFKSFTADNGSEFSDLYDLLKENIDVYFAHPYASWERGSSENQHKLIRRFFPKGCSLREITKEQCLRIQQWMNAYPRRILAYDTPYERFVRSFHQERQAI